MPFFPGRGAERLGPRTRHLARATGRSVARNSRRRLCHSQTSRGRQFLRMSALVFALGLAVAAGRYAPPWAQSWRRAIPSDPRVTDEPVTSSADEWDPAEQQAS